MSCVKLYNEWREDRNEHVTDDLCTLSPFQWTFLVEMSERMLIESVFYKGIRGTNADKQKISILGAL